MRRPALGLLQMLMGTIVLVVPAAQLIATSGSARAAIGDIIEYPVPSASVPEEMTAGPDGNIWFAEFEGKVAKVTTSGVVTEYSIPTPGGSPFGIAAGPDGNLWFTEVNGNKVAKVSTSGSFTEFTIPGSFAGPNDIAAGPDGNLWFTEVNANNVAKVTPSGTFSQYPIPTAASQAWHIVAGPDGNVWFTEPSTNKVAKVTTSGNVTEYTVPTPASRPTGIASGPDANLWFTEFDGQKVARLTPAGAFTEYPLPPGASGPNVITPGPDGNLWLSEAGANRVARLTTTGIFTEYPIPTGNSWPMGIATGPDGNVWFTEHNANNVAKLVAAPSPPPVPSSTYSPMSPLRVLDTRISGQTLGDGGNLNLQIGGISVPSNASAVVLNVTVTNTTAPGFLTLYPTGVSKPLASNLNWTSGETVANLVQVALGSGGQISIFNSTGSTDVVVDVEGFFYAPPVNTTAGEFVALSPNRITDTRPGSGWPNAGSTLTAGASLDVQVAGIGGVPATGVEAVVLNATVTGTTEAGYLTAYPKGSPPPLASNLNWQPGSSVPNRLVVPVGSGGAVSFFNSTGSTDLVIDVNGYFTDSTAAGSSFVPLTPARILDTRYGTGGFSGQLGQGALIAVTVAGQGGVPSTPPKAVVLNVTATNPSAAGYFTVWPDLLNQPPASDLNFVAGQTVPNLVIVKLGSDGKVDVYNAWGSTDVIFDVVGWYG